MEKHELFAEERTVIGKGVKAMRREGKIPAVMYGKGQQALPLTLDKLETMRALYEAGASTLIDLHVAKDVHPVLIREVQRDVLTNDLLHVDFLKVVMSELIRTTVPIDLIGEAPAVKSLGGLLVTELDEVEVEALPADLPESFVVDLSVLAEIDDAIAVSDIEVGEKVKILTEPETTIARIIYEVEEVIEEVEEAVPVEEEPEVVERGKREEEEGEAEE
jgi:large subunit ribosomal protein L25